MMDRTDQRAGDAGREATAVNERPDDQKLSTADIAAGKPQGATGEPTAAQAAPQITTSAANAEHTALFPSDEAGKFRSRWDGLQVGFVDDPKKTVEQADQLVADVMQRLAQIFADERSRLEQHMERGDQASTEDLRVALQRYRSFFGRLLSM